MWLSHEIDRLCRFQVLIGKDAVKAIADMCAVAERRTAQKSHIGPDLRSDHIFMPHSQMLLVSRAWYGEHVSV